MILFVLLYSVIFNDQFMADLIMKEFNPVKIKSMGRRIKGFNNQVWNEHKIKIVKKGNLAKVCLISIYFFNQTYVMLLL